MNIFISGPMSGIDDYNKPAFNAAAEKLRAMGHKCFNPAEPNRAGLHTASAWLTTSRGYATTLMRWCD